MRLVLYLLPLIYSLASFGAAASNECLGDLLSKSEKEEIKKAAGRFECAWEPTHVKRIDSNGDGILDFVVSNKDDTVVLIRKNGELKKQFFVNFGMRSGSYCPSRSGSICMPDIAQVPSLLQPGYDLIVRSWQGCALIRGSNTPWIYDKNPWPSERFDCDKYDNRGYLLAQAECVVTQGRWGALNWGNWGGCWHPAVDIGKPCKSSSDCQKLCLYKGPTVPTGAEVTGICSEYTPCRVDVINGRLGASICVD